MAVINHDCVRDLMLWLEDNQSMTSKGKTNYIKMKRVYPLLCEKYTMDDLHTAAAYIFEKKLVTSDSDITGKTPHWYVFAGFTTMGQDYLRAVRDNTIWAKIKSLLAPLREPTLGAIMQAAATIFTGKLGI